MDGEVGDLFVCEEYTLETFKFKEDVTQELYCLKSAVTDFDLTGQIVWPAAIALADYIIENKELFTGKNIIELGAGAGLSGFVAAQFANKVVLTDFMEVVMKLLHKNANYLKKDNIFVGEIAWGEESLRDINIENSFAKKFSKEDKIDIVMGADVIFWPESLDGLIKTLGVIN